MKRNMITHNPFNPRVAQSKEYKQEQPEYPECTLDRAAQIFRNNEHTNLTRSSVSAALHNIHSALPFQLFSNTNLS